MRFASLFLSLLIVSLILLPTGGASRVDEVLRMARTALAATSTPSPAPVTPILTPTLAPLQPANACDQPPPWTDLDTAQRCHGEYSMPLGQPIYEGCPAYLSETNYLICSGYYLAPPITVPPPPTPTIPAYP